MPLLLRRPAVLAAILLIAAADGCRRFKTTDELRAELRGEQNREPSWFDAPCQELVVDSFGWRADSIGDVRFRVPARVRSIPAGDWNERHYMVGRASLVMRLAPDAGALFRQFSFSTSTWRRVSCSISARPAEVATVLNSGEFITTVRWMEADRGAPLVAVARGRLLEEVQLMRAILFTMTFPAAGREPLP